MLLRGSIFQNFLTQGKATSLRNLGPSGLVVLDTTTFQMNVKNWSVVPAQTYFILRKFHILGQLQKKSFSFHFNSYLHASHIFRERAVAESTEKERQASEQVESGNQKLKGTYIYISLVHIVPRPLIQQEDQGLQTLLDGKNPYFPRRSSQVPKPAK